MLNDIVNQNNTDNSADYTFRSDSINDYLQEFSQPKNMIANEIEGFENLEFEPEVEKLPTAVCNANGKLITTVLDSSISTILGIVAKEDADKYKADSSDREDLEKAISDYVKIKGGDIPPGMMVFILILSIYGGKTYIAFQDRKINIEREKNEKKAKELEQREADLRIQEQMLKNQILQQNENLKNE